jgi:hypothetical protein
VMKILIQGVTVRDVNCYVIPKQQLTGSLNDIAKVNCLSLTSELAAQ